MLYLSGSAGASTVQMSYVGASNVAYGYYVGPYAGTMNGQPDVLFCVDIANEVTPGERWTANLTAITPLADLSQTRYGGLPGAPQLYQEAAWLALQFASQPKSAYGDIQATIWQLFNASGPQPSTTFWLGQARSNYDAGDYTDFRVVTNTAPVLATGQVQEFLTRVQPAQAAEPGTELLIGFGLVSLACAWRYARA
jgi:hypothetical protein